MFKKLIVVLLSVIVLTTIEVSFQGRKFNASREAAAVVGGVALKKATSQVIGVVPNNIVKSCDEALNKMGLKIMLKVTKESLEKEDKEKANIEVPKEVVDKEIVHNAPNNTKEANANSQPKKVEEKPAEKESNTNVEVGKETTPVTEKEEAPSEKLIKDLPSNHPISYRSDIEEELLALVNKLRVDNGLSPFTSVSLLKESSRYKSNSMVQLEYFSHVNPNYNNENSGYLLLNVFKVGSSKVGENIAMYTDRRQEKINAQGLYDLWYNSEAHRNAMLSDSYTKIGIGVVTTVDSDGRTKIYGTQHFAK